METLEKSPTTDISSQWYTNVRRDFPLHKCTTRGPLTEKALSELRATFSERSHDPSGEMWEALTAILSTMEDMADGTAASLIHISSLEPGVGKTEALLAFLRALLSSPKHRNTAALICISRLDEIGALVEKCCLPADSYSAFAAKDATATINKKKIKVNLLGCGDPTNARVLFTTHAMLERQCKGRPFAEVSAFHYRGRSRDVRVYDEAILPGRTLTISRYSVMSVVGPLRRLSSLLADELDTIQGTLKTIKDQHQFTLDDLATKYRVPLDAALSAVKGDELKSIVDALWGLFGKTVSVRRDGKAGNTLLEYEETLSPDVAPLLVLDASARTRATYPLWDERRGGIKWLQGAKKSYAPLTVHMWSAGGGKRAFRTNAGRLLEGIVKTINSKPNEQWLIVHHLNVGRNIEKDVRALVSSPEKVAFLNWGKHNATNEFKDFPNVILAGTLFYPPSYYEALTRLAANHPSSRGSVSEEDYREIELGEHRHLILQAVCRGAVRLCNGASCPRTDAYIIAAARSGIADELPKIFPDCRVVKWLPLTTTPKGKAGKAQEFILKALAEGASDVPFTNIKKHVGVPDAANFAKTIRKKIAPPLDVEGVIEWPRVRPTGYRRANAVYFGETN